MAKGAWWLPDKIGGTAVGEAAKWVWALWGSALTTILQNAQGWIAGHPNWTATVLGVVTALILFWIAFLKKSEQPPIISGEKRSGEGVDRASYDTVLGSARHWESRCNVVETQLKEVKQQLEKCQEKREPRVEELERTIELQSQTVAGLEKKIADWNNWSWLVNMAKNELAGNSPSGIVAKIQGIAIRADELSPHIDILLQVYNSLVWPVRISDRVIGYVECDGHKLQGPPNVEHGPGYIIQHSSSQAITLRQWLDSNTATFVKEQPRRYTINNIVLRGLINPGRQMSNHDEGAEIVLNTAALSIRS
jgi:hypothetical protein